MSALSHFEKALITIQSKGIEAKIQSFTIEITVNGHTFELSDYEINNQVREYNIKNTSGDIQKLMEDAANKMLDKINSGKAYLNKLKNEYDLLFDPAAFHAIVERVRSERERKRG